MTYKVLGRLSLDMIVMSNPHYQHFFSPVETDSCFGAAKDWPPLPALILLDCFDPEKRSTILEQAARHGHTVWILRLDRPSLHAEADLKKLRELRAKREVDLPEKSLVLHHIQCWSAANWDSQSSRYVSQLWLLRPPLESGITYTDPGTVLDRLGSLDNRRCDFHHDPACPPRSLNSYRTCQQDAVCLTGKGLFGGCYGSVDRNRELMGAGGVLTVGNTLAPGLFYRYLSLSVDRWRQFVLKLWLCSVSYNDFMKK